MNAFKSFAVVTLQGETEKRLLLNIEAENEQKATIKVNTFYSGKCESIQWTNEKVALLPVDYFVNPFTWQK